MKNSFIIIALIFSAQCAFSQIISPAEDTEFCPLQDITFTVTLPRILDNTVPSVASSTNGPIVITGILPSSIVNTPTQTTCTFVGRFRDVNINQVFNVRYQTNPDTIRSYSFSFKKIKSLFYNITPSTTCKPLQLNIASVTVPRCQIVNIPINFQNIQWSTYGENPAYCFGAITTYEYLLPKNWSIGNSTSDGTSWIKAGNNVTVTSDFSNGINGSIQVRPSNDCGINLANGYIPAQISISRPAPTLSITGNSFNLCNATTGAYTINGIPPGATVLWQVDNTTLAQINGPNNTNTINVNANSNGFNGDVVLTATVQQCTFTYPVTATITIGTGTPPTITNLNYDNRCGSFAEAYCNNPPNSTGFIWSFNFGQVIQNNPGYYGNYFKIQPIPNQSTPGNTYYDYLSVQATNQCGTSAPSATTSFTIGPIAANCGSGGGKGYLSTGPVIGQPLAETKAYTNNNVRVFPNPLRASLTIQLPDTTDLANAFITITNLDGRLIHSLRPNTLQPIINTTHWAAGTYLVILYEGNKKRTVQQIIKY
ncbi:MAG: T9SS type A sorting domain-containing protein [Bacteroidota bacterium]